MKKKVYMALCIFCTLLLTGCGINHAGTGMDEVSGVEFDVNDEQDEAAADTASNVEIVYVEEYEIDTEEELNDNVQNDKGDDESVTEIEPDISTNFSVTMLDVGQGLSILIQCDGETLLYDGGSREYSSYVVSYLKGQDISAVDYVVVSHYDEDHLAGIVDVLNAFEVETVICPDYETDTVIYSSYVAALASSDAEVLYAEVGSAFELGSAEFTVLSPSSYYYSDENDFSVGIRIECGDFSAIMCGDAGEDAEGDMLLSGLELDSDLYIVSHHGSAYSGTDEFIEAVSPVYAFISCGENNSYGHPAQSTLDTLLYYGAELYRSDVQGEVTAYYDGENVWFSDEVCDVWTAGGQIGEEAENDTNTEAITYVLNTNTMRFHYEDCSAVNQMSDKNKEYSTESREELILTGYSACGICNP